MNSATTRTGKKNWLHLLTGAGLLVSFFLPWVSWEPASVINGYSFPAGDFFKTAESKFGLGNPFPEYNFTLLAFWLIPVLVIIILCLAFANKKSALLACIAGALSLSLIAVFILFTQTLISLGAGKDLLSMLKPWIYVQGICAVGFILTAALHNSWLKRIAWILVGPVFAYASFMFIEQYLEKQTFSDTANVKTDFTISSAELIKEFMTNDTSANKKYLEKMLVVNGNTSAVEILADSSSTIKFADSTGSYAIFSLEKIHLDEVKKVKPGDAVSLKGVCSGSVFSEILGTTFISFKRSTFNKK